jgi:hypothetical protein
MKWVGGIVIMLLCAAYVYYIFIYTYIHHLSYKMVGHVTNIFHFNHIQTYSNLMFYSEKNRGPKTVGPQGLSNGTFP